RLEAQRVEPLAGLGVRRGERRRVGVADARDDIPVRAARWEGQRAARGEALQPLLRVEHVEQREQVVLVRAAAVEQDERALGLAGSGPLADDHALAARRAARGFGSGVRICSTCARYCS